MYTIIYYIIAAIWLLLGSLGAAYFYTYMLVEKPDSSRILIVKIMMVIITLSGFLGLISVLSEDGGKHGWKWYKVNK